MKFVNLKYRVFPMIAAMIFIVQIAYTQSPSNDCSNAAAQQLIVGTACVAVPFNVNSALGLPALNPCNL